MLKVFTSTAEADIDAIVSIENLSFQRPWDRRSFLSELDQPGAESLSVRRTDADGCGQIVAYVFFRLVADEMHILKIAVAPAYRGRGIATVLMQKSLELAGCRGCSAAYLEMRPANTAAKKLYRKLGFKEIGKRINYYPETGEDALVMSRKLEEGVCV